LDGAMLARVPSTAGRFTARVVVPGTETPGAHRLTAVAGSRSAAATLQTRVQWTQLGLYAAHRGANWYEHRLSPATVGQPTSPRHEAGEPAPCVLMVHGGPTAQSSARYQAQTAFWTSRGFGVADVDHGGSTGQGRAYSELLRGRWGEVDVDDCEPSHGGCSTRARPPPS